MSMKKKIGASFETLEIPDHSSFLLEFTRIYKNRGVEGGSGGRPQKMLIFSESTYHQLSPHKFLAHLEVSRQFCAG